MLMVLAIEGLLLTVPNVRGGTAGTDFASSEGRLIDDISPPGDGGCCGFLVKWFSLRNLVSTADTIFLFYALSSAPSCLSQRMSFHYSARREDEAKETSSELADKGGFLGTGLSHLYAIPVGVAIAVPIIEFEWYLVNEETLVRTQQEWWYEVNYFVHSKIQTSPRHSPSFTLARFDIPGVLCCGIHSGWRYD